MKVWTKVQVEMVRWDCSRIVSEGKGRRPHFLAAATMKRREEGQRVIFLMCWMHFQIISKDALLDFYPKVDIPDPQMHFLF